MLNGLQSIPQLAVGPPPSCVRKGGDPMSASCSPSSPLRIEMYTFIRSCETLLSSPILRGHTPLSSNERKIVEYYADELKAYLRAPQNH